MVLIAVCAINQVLLFADSAHAQMHVLEKEDVKQLQTKKWLLLKDNNKTTAEIDELVRGVKKQYTTGIVSFTIFRYLIIGVIFTAAGSGILMKRK